MMDPIEMIAWFDVPGTLRPIRFKHEENVVKVDQITTRRNILGVAYFVVPRRFQDPSRNDKLRRVGILNNEHVVEIDKKLVNGEVLTPSWFLPKH